jgi:zinc/manganese transport system substrate-binding protein
VRTVFKFAVCSGLLLAGHLVQAFTVFACEPEWGALTKALYPKAEVFAATNHLQDPHHVEARPSLIAKLRQADLAVCTGAGLESGWLPVLQARAGNPKVQDGQPTMFYAAKFVTLINPYAGAITPFSGDVHPEGNPHLHADPKRLLQVAAPLHERLIQLHPQDGKQIADNYKTFEKSMQAGIVRWEKQAQHLQGRTVVTQHSSFGYLWQWLGIQMGADLEPKPGMAPTPVHLERIRKQIQQSQPFAIVIAQHHDKRPAQWLSRQDSAQGIPMLVLPATVTNMSGTALIDWFDQLLSTLSQRPG